jgi:hypothetical protein
VRERVAAGATGAFDAVETAGIEFAVSGLKMPMVEVELQQQSWPVLSSTLAGRVN